MPAKCEVSSGVHLHAQTLPAATPLRFIINQHEPVSHKRVAIKAGPRQAKEIAWVGSLSSTHSNRRRPCTVNVTQAYHNGKWLRLWVAGSKRTAVLNDPEALFGLRSRNARAGHGVADDPFHCP